MKVLQEILEWSSDRAGWQRDALRRLVLNGELSNDDVNALTEICKSAHGLAEQQETTPLTKEDLPISTMGAAPVSLLSIFHHRGVNALAEDQILKFGPSLTVVYGDNGAGKTGYIRILKKACRARGQEHILGNVASGTSPLTPVVAISYKVGTETNPREWNGGGQDEFVSRVSVFDTQCAAIYLTEKTDVAFRPLGLDLFDKLVSACKAVRAKLEGEQRTLASNALTALQAQIPEGTAAAKFLSSVSSLTNPNGVQAIAHLRPEEQARLAILEQSLLDLQANNPENLIRLLTLRIGRVQTVVRHLKDVEAALAVEAVTAVFNAQSEARRKGVEAKRLCNATFPSGMLLGTGTEPWKALWESARHFSQTSVYPAKVFPVVEDGARCVLCQQDLDHAAAHRLMQFKAFVTSSTEYELRELQESFAKLRESFTNLKTAAEVVNETLKEIRIEHETVAAAIMAALDANERRREAIVAALAVDKDVTDDCPGLVTISHEAEALAGEIDERIKTLRKLATNDTRKQMNAEAQELRARKLLATHQKTILDDIERRKKYAAYGLCIDETKTQAITQKSTAVTKAAVSQRLKQSFTSELANLSFSHIEVELKELGGTDGVFYHKLALIRAPGVDLPKVVSEGEQRCLSIAAFFAELSTADDRSGIVFDDPVSSLDYQWRQGVARRLVQEAKTRQIIVFTHDVVFLLLLKQFAHELGVEQFDQHVRFFSNGAGVCTEELPWVALTTKKKIGYLKTCWQAADKCYRDGHLNAYEKEAKYLYGLLRESWERALEEVLLGGVVERYRPNIQTLQISQIADITDEDCKMVQTAMTKCSKWLAGHDQAAAARAPVPSTTELKADIEALENWVAAIRKRRTYHAAPSFT